MKPWDMLIPDLMCDTVRDVPFETFFDKGARAVVFDIDNTLVSYDTPRADDGLIAFLCDLSTRVPVALLSNNDEARVSLFNTDFGFVAVSEAGKPGKKALLAVSERLQVPSEQILFVGDQLLTDVLCARRAGALATVTVRPVKERENLFFRFKRLLERPFVAVYRRRKRKEK
ncbi:MAG: YqeG family HAD IIIA-type phosphatase [Clostridia bacterium]|nr:YqeG family HAD IIIA-type phosphatase [Clostridia bacterium]